jgi:uncharacterized protein (DUF885 family)
MAALPGCGRGEKVSAEWEGFVDRFVEDYFKANPDFAVDQGRHEFDGQWPDWSAEGLRNEIARLQAARQEAAAFDAGALTAEQRFERDYLLAVIDNDLFWLEKAEGPWRSPAYYGFKMDPDVYLTRPYAPLAERMRAFTRWARGVPRAAEQIRANLRTPLPRTYIYIGRIAFGGLASYFENDVPGVFAEAEDAALQAQFTEAVVPAVKSLKELDAWLEAQESEATENYALGTELFSEMLRTTEGVDVPLDRLEEIGRADLERNLKALKEACEKYAPGKSIRECVQKAQANKPAQGPVQGARDQLDGLEKFVREKKLVSIPGTEQALVNESPPHNRSNSAYISIPGPYEKGLPSVYYIAPPDPSWTAEEQAAYIDGEAALLFTSVHEVWPGHFLQFLHANRSQSKVGRLFVGYAYAEGWAHYSEELMWEAGYSDGDPEIHIGQLLNALLRNVRYLSAIGLHTKGMAVEESEKMFRESGYQDPGNARQQAARGTYDPAYLNYTLGKLMIRRLRDDWTKSRGGQAAWGQFHDEFLSYGGPPIPLVRRAMLGKDAGPPL